MVTHCCFSSNSVSAGNGGNGGSGAHVSNTTIQTGPGGPGGSGGHAGGAALHAGSGQVRLINSTIHANSAFGGNAGDGGDGGTCDAGSGGGNKGGDGGKGGNALGAGLSVQGIGTEVIAYNDTFARNFVVAGSGGAGGVGGFSCRVGGHPNGVTGHNGTNVAANHVAEAGLVSLLNTLVAYNGGGSNCFGNITDLGHNISSDATPPFTNAASFNHTDPQLGPLADNGGPTPTVALLSGSPAIDQGNDAVCPSTDQRGVPRPQHGQCDIGAY